MLESIEFYPDQIPFISEERTLTWYLPCVNAKANNGQAAKWRRFSLLEDLEFYLLPRSNNTKNLLELISSFCETTVQTTWTHLMMHFAVSYLIWPIYLLCCLKGVASENRQAKLYLSLSGHWNFSG